MVGSRLVFVSAIKKQLRNHDYDVSGNVLSALIIFGVISL